MLFNLSLILLFLQKILLKFSKLFYTIIYKGIKLSCSSLVNNKNNDNKMLILGVLSSSPF